ncbi:sialic acid-binding Ig-like lectin 10 isoform X2 [Pseudoliparis swirei]|uniref:sialic acid-binding Ig-like lectin 10 isoform X2 n=1 Tax=Pseudoliparis swirei TaxID=2059687 RepID=UPI0024BE9F2D|nr:sialic acid-binding Ig-like lectin 10 isoform X2 [Pseudoliparis swirei]
MGTNKVLLSLLLVSGAWACNQDLLVTAPHRMEALSGSCLQIPCNFSAKNGHDFINTTTFGLWIKNDSDVHNNQNNLIFDSRGTVTTYPMEFIGKLNKKNCTTLFSSLQIIYTDVYFFRAENDVFMATSTCDSFRITVQDSAPKPRIEIPAALKEKESVSVSCHTLSTPPKLTWNLQQDAPAMMEENTDRTFTTKIQKIMALSEEHDGFTITCSASYPVNEGTDKKTAEETTTLKVSYAPKDTSASISPSGPVSAGSWVNLTCSSRANPPVSRFLWFKNSLDGPVTVFQGDFYRFNVTDGGVYYCVATNQLGNQSSSEIHLTIEGG